MDVFARLERDHMARRGSGELERCFRAWRAGHPALAEFDDPDALIAACRGQETSRELVDAALSALCAEAAAGDEAASVLVLWLLLPGLLLARARLMAIGALEPEELDAEMVAAVWLAAGRISPGTRRVASRLVNAARWRALRAIREAIDHSQRTEPTPPDEVAEAYLPVDPEADPATGAVRDGVLSPADAALVHADHRVLVEIGERLGISLATIRKRRHRARVRLRAWLDD